MAAAEPAKTTPFRDRFATWVSNEFAIRSESVIREWEIVVRRNMALTKNPADQLKVPGPVHVCQMRVGEFRLGLLLSVASSRSGAASHATPIMSFRAGSLSWMRQRRGTELRFASREDDQGGTRSHSGLFTA
jgi:hypothetical protein